MIADVLSADYTDGPHALISRRTMNRWFRLVISTTAVTCCLFLLCILLPCFLLSGYSGKFWTCIKIGVFGVMFLWFAREGKGGSEVVGGGGW
jgi:hypothetical protein